MTTTLETMVVKAADGRELCVEVQGDDGGAAILVCAGTPNSRHLYAPWVEDAISRGARLIGYDRPGYGHSTAKPGRSVADAADDVRAIADHLGIDRLAVWGFSGGGPHAIACAARLDDLIYATGVVCSIAPWNAPGLDFFSGMGEMNRKEIELYLADPDESRRRGKQSRDEMLEATPDSLLEAWESLVSPVDLAAAEGELAEYIVGSVKHGLEPGDQGWWDDGVAHLSPWGFELDSIRMPVKVWHGAQDRFVPFQHGQWLAAQIPNAEADLSQDDGHLTLLTGKVPHVHEWLLGHR